MFRRQCTIAVAVFLEAMGQEGVRNDGELANACVPAPLSVAESIALPQIASGLAPSPEIIRRQWDALLAVINDASTCDAPIPSADRSLGNASGAKGRLAGPSEIQAAQALLGGISAESPHNSRSMRASSSAAAIGTPSRKQKQSWDPRHQLAFSVCNDKVQKNTRNYFDRHREIERYGTEETPPLEPTWSLAWRPSSSQSSPNLVSPGPSPMASPSLHQRTGSQAASPKSAISRSTTNLGASLGSSSPNGSRLIKPWSNERENLFGRPLVDHSANWNLRHQVVFAKDNRTYHANCREYFDRPKRLLY